MIIDICPTARYLKIIHKKPRIHLFGALYHVGARGNSGRKIPLDNEPCSKNRCQACTVDRYVSINGAYTNYLNMKRKRSCHLFQGRYKALLIDTDEYALGLSRYIHLNPVKARMVEKPEQYKWSSYRDLMNVTPMFLTWVAHRCIIETSGFRWPVFFFVPSLLIPFS